MSHAPPPSTGLRHDPFLDQTKALACVHCGLCLGTCPTYLETGNENDSPRGRIHLMRALHEGRTTLNRTNVGHLDLCLGCRACEPACPSGVRYGALLEETRDHIRRNWRRSAFDQVLRRILIERVVPHPRRFALALWPPRLIRGLGFHRILPARLRTLLDLLPEVSDASPLPAHVPTKLQQRRGTVGFIRGCVMSVLFGPTNAASVALLNRAGYDVAVPARQGCCGALHAHGGNVEAARDCARRNLAAFEGVALDAVVVNAAGCGSTLKEYGELLQHDAVWADRANRFARQVRDLSEILVQSPGFTGPRRAASRIHGRVTVQDACHLAHAQRVTRAPRDLVRAIAADSLVEMPESDICCGSAGSYNLTEPEMAARLQRRKVENILRSGATLVVTTNPGCLLQMRAGLKLAGANHVQVLHLADYLLTTGESFDEAETRLAVRRSSG